MGFDIFQLRKPDHLGSQNGRRTQACSTVESRRMTASKNMKLIRCYLDIRRMNHKVRVHRDLMELLYLEMFLQNKIKTINICQMASKNI